MDYDGTDAAAVAHQSTTPATRCTLALFLSDLDNQSPALLFFQYPAHITISQPGTSNTATFNPGVMPKNNQHHRYKSEAHPIRERKPQ